MSTNKEFRVDKTSNYIIVLYNYLCLGNSQMSLKPLPVITLESLGNGIPVMQPEAVGFYKQNCMVCFHLQGHRSGVPLRVHTEDSENTFEILWNGKVTEQMLRSYADLTRATDNAACAIALLLIRELTDFTTIEQSYIGTTIDYYLAPKIQDETLIFNHSARLEVSGILKENKKNTVQARVNRKIKRLKSENDLPSYIVVVEFSEPWSKMVMV